MEGQDVASLVGLVALFTFIFDVVDLQPQIGSFRFILSFSYAFYLLFRTILGFLASLALRELLEDDPATYMLALLGALSSITILQNFALNVGGTSIANLTTLRDTYRAKMLLEHNEREALQRQSRSLALRQAVSALPSDGLKTELRRMLSLKGFTPDQANAQVTTYEQAAQGDDEFLRIILASNITEINPNRAQQLVDRNDQGQGN